MGDGCERQPLFSSLGAVHFEAGGLELKLQYAAKLVFVFDNQYSSGSHILKAMRLRESHFKGTPGARFTEDSNTALVLVYDLCHKRKAQAHSLGLGSKERIENIFQM